MDVHAELDAPCPADVLFGWIDDLTRYREWLDLVVDTVGLRDRLKHRPSELSGGQQQRVALCRALVYRPPVILMDEPLGALDKKLRDQLQTEIKRIQQELGLTVIYVTHDQSEAMGLGDRIAVMELGRVRQLAPPVEVYDDPADTFVATFLGSPPMNLVVSQTTRIAMRTVKNPTTGRSRRRIVARAAIAQPVTA